MLRNVLAGSMTLLTGLFVFLLLSAIVISCRQNGDPHHTESTMYVQPPASTSSAQEAHSSPEGH